jgi:hypothetical protein
MRIPEWVIPLLWPIGTAVLNLLVAVAGHSDRPWGKFLAAVGTTVLKRKEDAQ